MAVSEKNWSVPVRVEDIPEGGRHYRLSPDAALRPALAARAGIDALRGLDADFEVTRHGAGLAVKGTVNAQVRQTCVVTLDPVENAVAETVDLVFLPGAGERGAAATAAEKDDDSIEPLVGDTIDLGAIATEFLVLGVDPYPRKPGAVFTPPTEAVDSHPFAALAALKKGRTGSGD